MIKIKIILIHHNKIIVNLIRNLFKVDLELILSKTILATNLRFLRSHLVIFKKLKEKRIFKRRPNTRCIIWVIQQLFSRFKPNLKRLRLDWIKNHLVDQNNLCRGLLVQLVILTILWLMIIAFLKDKLCKKLQFPILAKTT